MRAAVCLIMLAAMFGVATAVRGVDVSQLTSVDAFKCLVENGHSFAVVRVFTSVGHPDSNGAQSIKNAWAAGMSHVDGYIFPDHAAGNPEAQVDATIQNLAAHGATVGMLWIDVEAANLWSSNHTNNVDFIRAMVTRGEQKGMHIGIYTSASQWGPIGGDSPAFADLPLWYAHYDDNPSFSDWRPFGGWSKPAIKQYKGTTSTCGASVDLNFY